MKTKKTIISALALALLGGGVAVASPAQAGVGGGVFNADSNGRYLSVKATGGSGYLDLYNVPPSHSSREYAPNAVNFSIPSGCAQVIVNGKGPARVVGAGTYSVYGSDQVWVRRVAC